MMWLVLVIIAVVFFFLLLRKPVEGTAQQTLHAWHDDIVAHVAPATEDEELLAVITAAVAECEGTGDFQVVSIKPSGRNWALTARQEQLHSRL